MKSSQSNAIKLDSPIESLLHKKQISERIIALKEARIETIRDLLLVIPLRAEKVPPVDSFDRAQPGHFFKGQGEIFSLKSRPLFGRKGKNRALLHQITLYVKDTHKNSQSEIMKLQWFNAYGTTLNKLKSLKSIVFFGEINEWNGQFEIVNPVVCYDSGDEALLESKTVITYPTVNGVPGKDVEKLISKIPEHIWESIEDILPKHMIEKNGFLSRGDALKTIHGKLGECDEISLNASKRRLIYDEFLDEQIKVLARKSLIKEDSTPSIVTDNQRFNDLQNIFNYTLTDDQKKACEAIRKDLASKSPMMRLIQGDVGCGKTSVSIIPMIMAVESGYQVALLCPTETLAEQHASTISEVFKRNSTLSKIRIGTLLGSYPAAYKKNFLSMLSRGEIDIAIGTHTLIQQDVKFHNLALSVIDEQHKFGVEQRLTLVAKSKIKNTLILTATPIPRSLSLTQYGDLDISIIKSMPEGRRPVKTRIITPDLMDKFLSFLKTRIALKEQAYIVVPAIEESTNQEKLNLENIKNTYERFRKFYPELSIQYLHGRMKGEEKNKIIESYFKGKIDILISTSVIEVGIDAPNATLVAIMNPERFGLSSLHQLRGRVGRRTKQGFCFLITDSIKSETTYERLKIMEETNDGFKIAEKDLELRGEGELFGTLQSGVSSRRLANIITHQDILFLAIDDAKKIQSENPGWIKKEIDALKSNTLITTTI